MNYMQKNYQNQTPCCPSTVQRTSAMPCPQTGDSRQNQRMTECRMSQQENRGCACGKNNSYDSMSQMQLLNYINEVSFAVSDILLFLDTHPYDSEALAYSREMVGRRREAMAVYARRFGPLTIDCTNEAECTRWEWVMQPWPWESMSKGGCR